MPFDSSPAFAPAPARLINKRRFSRKYTLTLIGAAALTPLDSPNVWIGRRESRRLGKAMTSWVTTPEDRSLCCQSPPPGVLLV